MTWTSFALASALFAGLTAILAKVGIEGVPSNLATLLRMVVLFPFLLILVSLRHEWQSLPGISTRGTIFLALSGIATGLSWLCYFRALQLGPASIVSALDKLSLVVAVLLAVIFLSEKLNAWQWGGVLMMAAGAVLLLKK